ALFAGCGCDVETAVPPPDVPTARASDRLCDARERDPGRVTLHRLNRTEYDNTVRDLLGESGAPARGFPSDEHGDGFDNNADVLTFGPLLFEKYEAAAELLIDRAWSRDYAPAQHDRLEAERLAELDEDETAWTTESGGELAGRFELRSAGSFTFSAAAWGTSSGGRAPTMVFAVDGREIARFDVENRAGAPRIYRAEAEVASGTHTFAVAFANPSGAGLRGAGSLSVDWLAVERPGHVRPPEHARLRVCDPVAGGDGCARAILEAFLPAAYRRPVDAAEVDRAMRLVALAVAEGDGHERGVKLALASALLSPHFLFRVELDPEPGSEAPHPLTPHELASRLSYFLWSSMPDAALLDAARTGELSHREGIERQVRRMLDDPKAEALVSNFAGQWLHTR
ncbi:MAG: DUF1592 domain-containing protein, partial [Myxococcales bacterium]